MISLKDFILGEGIIWTSDSIVGGFSNKSDWWFYKDDKNTEVVFHNVTSQNYSILRNGSKYFLSNSNKEYLGSVVLSKVKDATYKIDNADSNIKGGFYVIMFSNLLRLSEIKEIQSDRKMSKSAISAWEKLTKSTPLTVNVYDYISQSLIEASEEHYLLDGRNYFVCTMDSIHEEFFDEYEESIRIQSGYFYENFCNKHAVIDWKLYGDFYGFINSNNVTIDQINRFETFEVTLESHSHIIGEYEDMEELIESFDEVFQIYPYLKEKITFKGD